MPISNGEAIDGWTSSRRGWVGEFRAVDTVATPSHVQTFVTAFEVRDDANRLAPSAMTAPKAKPPARTS